ncbi:hypothetical protein BS78_04G191600 [Paspalum vaginatum]|nr:hypothetical protein BS78_04G191600 [Paspalum vaginatum]
MTISKHVHEACKQKRLLSIDDVLYRSSEIDHHRPGPCWLPTSSIMGVCRDDLIYRCNYVVVHTVQIRGADALMQCFCRHYIEAFVDACSDFVFVLCRCSVCFMEILYPFAYTGYGGCILGIISSFCSHIQLCPCGCLIILLDYYWILIWRRTDHEQYTNTYIVAIILPEVVLLI